MRLPKFSTLLLTLVALTWSAPAWALFSCLSTCVVSGGGSGKIATCLAGLGGSLTQDTCIDIQDSLSYSESASVSNIANNGFRLAIGPQSAANHPTITGAAGSAPVFTISVASVTLEGVTIVPSGGATPTYGVVVTSPTVTLSSITISDPSQNISLAGVILADTQDVVANSTISVTGVSANGLFISSTAVGAGVFFSSIAASGNNNRAVLIYGASSTVSQCVMAAPAGFAMQVAFNGANNLITHSTMTSISGSAAAVLGGGPYNTISFSSMTGSSAAPLWLSASSNTVTQSAMSSGGGAVLFDIGATSNTVDLSTITVSIGAESVRFNGWGNSLTRSRVFNNFTGAGAYGIRFDGAGSFLNGVNKTTVTLNSTGYALWFNGWAATNTVANSYLSTLSGGLGVYAQTAYSYAVLGSTIVGGGASINGTNGGLFSQDFIGGPLAIYGGSVGNTVYLSTVTGLTTLSQAANTTIANSYLTGSHAAIVQGSTATAIVGSVLVVTGGAGVWVQNGGSGLIMSSDTVLMAGGNRAVQIDQYFGGLVAISSNTLNFTSVGIPGVGIGTMTTGGTVWISSNIFLPDLATGGSNNIALSFNGLTSGATVQYNSFYYRDSGVSGLGYSTIYAISSPGLTISHNRINQFAQMSGAYTAIALVGSPNAGIKYNDLNVNTGAATPFVAMVYLATGSTNVQVMDNVFYGGLGNNTTATLYVDALSETGFYANYNDYYSGGVGSPSALCAGTRFPLGHTWNCGGPALDGNSISIDPLWFNTAAGLEDFHPKSLQGRWSPPNGFFTPDATNSLTIDSGDPNDDYSLESPVFGGGRVNLGSYGDTAEASLSAAPGGYPGCAFTAKVGAGQSFGSVSAAVAALPATLSGVSCVVIEDGATYNEQVLVEGINNAGFPIRIFADPVTGLLPTVTWNAAGNAVFQISNASVSVTGLQITVSGFSNVNDGVLVTSPTVSLTSMTVLGNTFMLEGVRLQDYDRMTLSTVTTNSPNGVSVYGSDNLISTCTITNNGVNGYGLTVYQTSNTVTRTTVNSPTGPGISLSGARFSTVSFSTAVTGSGFGGLSLNGGASSNTITHDNISGGSGNALMITFSQSNVVTLSSISSTGGNAVYIGNASSNTVSASVMTSGTNSALVVDAGSVQNAVLGSTVATNTFLHSAFDIRGSSNAFTQLRVSNPTGQGLLVEQGANGNLFARSVFFASDQAVYIDGGSSNTVTQSSMTSTSNASLQIDFNATNNLVQQSTVTGSGPAAVYITGASSNTVDLSLVWNPGPAVEFNGTQSSVISFSSLTDVTAGAGYAFTDYSGVSDAVVGSYLSSRNGSDVVFNGAQNSTVSQSTMTSGSPTAAAVQFLTAQGCSATGDYIVTSSTGVAVTGSTGTVLTGDVVAAGYAAVRVNGGSVGLTMNQTVLGPQNNGSFYGLELDPQNSGVIDISSNIFVPGPTYQAFVTTQAVGATVSFSSNTFYPNPTGPVDFYGLYLVGVNGASIQNNSFYYRANDFGAGSWNRIPVYAQSSANLNIIRNRIDDSNVVTNTNNFTAISFVGTTGSTLKFNDINGTGATLKNAILLSLANGSTGNTFKDNVFSFAFSGVTTTNKLIVIDAASVTGQTFDYNDYFSANGSNFASCNGSFFSLAQSWTCGGTQDSNSISTDPLWVNVSSGTEDLHPQSQAGHFSILSGWVNDGVTSPTIDAGDPAEPNNLEPPPNGSLVNQGSYGDTPEASKTPAGPCAITRKVCKTGACSDRSIQTALNSLPTTLPGYTCVIIEDSSNYAENVKIAGFNMNGSSLTVMLDPSLGIAHPTITPPSAASPGLKIADSSVTVIGIDVFLNGVGGIQYGVQSTSAGVVLTSVTVFDSFNDAALAEIAVTTGTAISYSTVTVGPSAGSAHGIYLEGTGSSVSFSSVTLNGPNGSTRFGIYVNGASSTTITHTVVSMPNTGDAVHIDHAGYAAVSFSSFNSVNCQNALSFTGDSYATVTNSYLYGGGGQGMNIDGASNGISIAQSTIAALSGGNQVVYLGGNGNSLLSTFVDAVSGNGVNLSGGFNNTLSSVVVSAKTSATFALNFNADINDTVSYSTFTNLVGQSVIFQAGASGNTLSYSSVTTGIPTQALYMTGVTGNVVTHSYIANAFAYPVYLQSSSSNTISFSTMAGTGVSPGLFLQNSSSNTFYADWITATQSTVAYFDSASGYNAVDLSTVVAAPGLYGVFFAGASWNQVFGSVIDGGLWMDVTAVHNSVLSSTMMASGAVYALNLETAQNNSVSQSYIQNLTGGAAIVGGGMGAWQNSISNSVIVSSGVSPALSLNGASTNTFTNDFITAVAGYALFYNNSTSNTVTGSTVTNASGISGITLVSNSSTNTISNSYLANLGTGSGYGAAVQSGSSGFLFTGDTIFAAQNDAFIAGGAGTTITQSFVIAADGNAIDEQFAPGLSVSFSTLTSVGGIGFWVRSSTGVVLTNSYVQGSTAVWVNGSTATLVGASRLFATTAGGYGLVLNGGSVGLTVSSSVVSGGAGGQSAAIMVSSANSGAIVISSNTVLPGSAYGIFIATMVGATPIVVVSSNTIFPTVGGPNSTCGLCIDGVTVGVAISGNSIYYRSSGSMGANTAYGLYALSSSGLQIDHNRISNPGMVTGGGFVGAIFAGSSGNFKFNDLYMSGSALASAYGLQFINAGAMTVKDNSFVNGEVNPGSFYTVAVFVDANSQTGYTADYNDFFFEGSGSQSFLGAWGTIPGSHPNTLGAWTTLTAQDAHSVVGDPLWANIVPGSEDFHPKSAATNGRFSPATLSFSVTDSSGSPSIDAADPTEPYNQELTPNGLVANCGSYGDTPQASKTAPLPGCGVEYTVAPGGGANYTSINQALTAVPLIGTTLTQNTCIIITQPGVISEEVDVYGIVPNNNRLIIMGHPNLPSRAIIDPTGNPEAFLINNDSVTLKNLDIKPSIAANYGVLATSASLTISGVNVDSGNKIALAGLFVTTGATISNSSVTVQNAYALLASGKGLTVAQSSFTNSAAFQEAVLLTGASNGSITQTLVANTAAWYGLGLSSGANGNAIASSTITSAGPSVAAFYINASSLNSVSNSVIGDASGSGALLTGGAYGNSIVASALSGNLAGGYALKIAGSSNTVATSFLNNPLGTLLLLSGGGLNAVTLSTASGGTGPVLQVSGSSGNVLTQDYFADSGVGAAALFDGGSAFNRVDQTTFSAAGDALDMNPASSNTFSRSVFTAGFSSKGLFLTNSDSNNFNQDAVTVGNASFGAYWFGSSSNTLLQSVVTSQGGGTSAVILINSANFNVVSQSSVTSGIGGNAGVFVDASIGDVIVNSTVTGKFGVDDLTSTGTVIMGSYISGSTAVFISGSEATVIGGSVLVATSTIGMGVDMTGGSNGLQLSSSVIYGGATRGGLYLDNGNAGLIVVSTNLFTSVSERDVYVATQNPGTAIWFTSNTFLSQATGSNNPMGLDFEGLITGATVQNNSFLVAAAGGLGGGHTMIGLNALTAAGLQVDHNRFSDANLVSGGGTYYSVSLAGAPATTFKFNDVNASDPLNGLTVAALLKLVSSPNAVVKDNVFMSSLTVIGSSQTITLDAASAASYSGDYNDFYSSAGVSSLQYGATVSSFPWAALIPADSHSIAYNPRWPSVVPGAEDFHPLSNAARFVTGAGFNGGDGWSAATIDAADPSEGTGSEPGPNGARGNLGSYGLTLEASKTPGAPTAPSVTAVSSYSVTVTFGPVGSTGQAVIASTSPSFTTSVASGTPTAQNNLAPQGLIPNTTYFLEVGALYGDLFVPNTTVLSTATLAAAPAGNPPGSFTAVGSNAVSALWQPNGNPLNVTTYTVVFTTGSLYPNADANNVVLSTTPVGNPPEATSAALIPNTTYFVFAAAINVESQPSAFTLLGSTSTVPATPVFVIPSVVGDSSTTVSVAWGANGNPVGITTFTVVASTAANFNAFASSVTLSTAPPSGPTATLGGMSPNTTYYFEVAAYGNDGQTSAFLQFVTTMTMAQAPAVTGIIAPVASQLNVAWTAPANPAGTQYLIQTSTDPAYNGVVTSSFTYNLFLTTAGLATNTTYYFQGAALNARSVATPFVPFGGGVTLANSPGAAGVTFLDVAATSMSVAWSHAGNPQGTNYFVELSTDAAFSTFATSVTFSTAPAGPNPTATFNGLAANTTYYFRVDAISFGGAATVFTALGSTTTTPPSLLPPVVQTFTSITTGTITATWTLMPGATGYALAASTYPANPPTVIWTSSAPVGLTATTATISGLDPNTTYFLFVQALGPGAASLYSAFPAAATFVALPLTAVTTFSAVNFTSAVVSWSADANPLAMTTYTVVASTASDFNAFASSVVFSTVPAAGPSATLTGMLANTTYYFEVSALGLGATMTAFVPLGSTTTPVAAPTVPALPFLVATSTDLVVAWGSTDPLVRTTYTVVASTASDFNAGALSVTLTTAPSAGPGVDLSGLMPNTTYFVEVAALGVNGSSSGFVVLGATSTAAQPPTAAAFSAVTAGGITANWTAGLDPAGTLYGLQASTSAAFGGVVTISFTFNTAVSTAGLAPNTTYYFRAQAVNNDGVATAYTALGATSTLANPPLPVGISFTMVGVTSVTANWNANGDPLAFTTYTVIASTANDFNAFATSVTFSTVPVSGPAATVTGLAFGTTWYFEVKATNSNGIPTAFAVLGSTYTPLSNLVPLIVNFQGGDTVYRSANNGLYDVRFQDGSGLHLDKFQVKASTSPNGTGTDLIAFTDVAINLSPADSYTTKWALPAAVYNAMIEGVTNYVTVTVYNGVPSSSTKQDAFYVLKDTTPPVVTNNAAGGDLVVRSTATSYDVRAKDLSSGLAGFQYSASLVKLSGDQSLVPWTNIAVLNGATSYTTPWALSPGAFAALPSGTTSFISVRAFDVAGNTTTVVDAFFVLKDTVGPTVSISSPVVGSGYVSAIGTIVGTSSSPFPVQGTEVAVLDVAANLYWNPGASLFNSGAAVFMVAAGSPTWSLNPGIPYQDGKAYKIVARSSSTVNFYSTVYATAAFVADLSTPTVGVQAPVPNSTVGSLPVISGTALDPGGAASGLSSVEVELERLSDGKFWNWFTQTWGVVGVSTVATGTTNWQLAPTPLLMANLTTNSSYYVAVRASDNATPPNQGNFFTQGATFTFSNPTPPAPVSDLAAVGGILPGQIALTWHATGENNNSGIILSGQYSIFYATYAAAPASTATAQVAFATSSVSPGAASVFTVGGLSAGVTYYLQIALQNTDGNWSGFSNQASTVATPAPLNAIEGHVVNSSTQGITGVEVDAWNTAGALVSTTFTLADGSGTYTVGGLSPGAYKLQATWTVNGVTSSVWQDSIPMGTVGVDYSLEINYALATLTGSLATLTTSAARTGFTAAALARPASGGSFVEVAQRGRTITKVGVQPSGRWTVPNLLPGSYSVRAFTGVSYTDYQDVNLVEGQTMTIGFVFDPLPDNAVFAFPNPAKDSTTFRFLTPFAAPFDAVIDVFDIAGRLVKEIPGSMIQPTATPALYHADWDLTNNRGQAVASGVYIYIVKVKDGTGTVVKVVKKLAVVR